MKGIIFVGGRNEMREERENSFLIVFSMRGMKEYQNRLSCLVRGRSGRNKKMLIVQ